MSKEQLICEAGVRQIVGLERRLADGQERLQGLAVWAAGRALAEGENADRAAWATMERHLHQVVDVLRTAAGERTAAGPGGVPADGPDGGGVEPLGGPVVIGVPASAWQKANDALWWLEEAQRANEVDNFERADAIRRELIRAGGLLSSLKAQLADVIGRLGVEAGDGA